ncbi:hypothetical protein GLOIN_2v1770458 [Rhizophagus irregularis DAOM 181602=DAOM 197198]|uniref:Uncharacterized protein n=1 Tax=Rhizophagus irregularis (strain DAOM 181602 / DAOM 197198 / MUCL 43194) TaxID=747089 RepID=A0A2P4QC84_RHIID|nr:hypothetical protein GLOIN_2v1770458 [Rhizophagus irregularis DAOM 181602=DAOM 197198]POG75247.1 hypothetical protein GLOIN_2v1770458 [Rhizophagus irregularis DAOM 181602=DAOM 197198]|eukprot:XP_025182113.1 hypothetical protein GLOIN_2v1770458 [Rhizophagus irregularis DAOM 181602=DAOM 197198]
MIQEFSKVIPVNEQRLSTNGKWQNDPFYPKKLLSFTINEAKNAIEPSSKTMFDNLNTLIEKKGFTALSNNEYTSLIDESASFTITRKGLFWKIFAINHNIYSKSNNINIITLLEDIS